MDSEIEKAFDDLTHVDEQGFADRVNDLGKNFAAYLEKCGQEWRDKDRNEIFEFWAINQIARLECLVARLLVERAFDAKKRK
jgi:hypothetical protein